MYTLSFLSAMAYSCKRVHYTFVICVGFSFDQDFLIEMVKKLSLTFLESWHLIDSRTDILHFDWVVKVHSGFPLTDLQLRICQVWMRRCIQSDVNLMRLHVIMILTSHNSVHKGNFLTCILTVMNLISFQWQDTAVKTCFFWHLIASFQ